MTKSKYCIIFEIVTPHIHTRASILTYMLMATHPVPRWVGPPLEDGALLVGVALVLRVALVRADRQRRPHSPRRPQHRVLQALQGLPAGTHIMFHSTIHGMASITNDVRNMFIIFPPLASSLAQAK